jgi:hypothetical protein
MAGGGVEFFDQGLDGSLAGSLAKDGIKCQKDYAGCVYSAQGAILCGLKQMSPATKQSGTKETFVPGMVIGGIPNMPALPNFKALTEQNTEAQPKPFF